MSRINLANAEVFINKVPSATFITDVASIPVLAADYKRVKSEIDLFIPKNAEFIRNENMIGAGESGLPSRLYRWNEDNFTFGGELNTDLAGHGLLRTAGGTVTDTLLTAAQSWKHEAAMMARTATLPKQTIVIVRYSSAVGFVLVGGGADGFSAEWSDNDPPSYQWSLAWGGVWFKISEVTGLGVALDAVPAAAEVSYANMHGAAVGFVYNDGSAQNPVTALRVKSGGFSIANNTTHEKLTGGVFRGNDRTKGAFNTGMRRGARRNLSMNVVEFMDDSGFPELDNLTAQTNITNATMTFGGYNIGASTDKHEIELKFATAKQSAISESPIDGYGGFAMSFEPKDNTTSLIPDAIVRVANEQSTMQ